MTAWTVFSNFAFVIPAIRGFLLGEFSEGFILLTIFIISFLWHTCYESGDSVCHGQSFEFWKLLDDFAALYVFVVILVYLAALSKSRLKPAAYFVGGVVVYAGQLAGGDKTAIIWISIYAAIVIALRLMLDWKSYPYEDLDIIDLVAGGLFSIGGLLIYALHNTDTMHGWWHVLLSVGCYFALESLHHRYTLIFWRRK